MRCLTNRLILLLLSSLWLVACAERPPSEAITGRRAEMLNSTPEQRATWQTQQLRQALMLSTAQATSVTAINLAYARQMQPLIERGTTDRAAIRTLRRLAAARDRQMKTVLTPDQYQRYQSRKQARQQQAGRS